MYHPVHKINRTLEKSKTYSIPLLEKSGQKIYSAEQRKPQKSLHNESLDSKCKFCRKPLQIKGQPILPFIE